MRIVIVGASRFGISTTVQLVEAGHEVVLVDRDRERLESLSNDLDCGFICGDGTLPSVQRDAFADHADALILLTNADDENVLAALVGRSIGFGRVIPQIVREELIAVCDELGLDDMITPHATVARSIVRTIESHDDPSLELRVHKNFDLMGYHVGERQVGKTIGELGLPSKARVVALTRGEEDRIVEEETELRDGDRLIVAVAPEAKARMRSLFDSGGEGGEG